MSGPERFAIRALGQLLFAELAQYGFKDPLTFAEHGAEVAAIRAADLLFEVALTIGKRFRQDLFFFDAEIENHLGPFYMNVNNL